MRKQTVGPSLVELRLRSELDVARRELRKHQKEAAIPPPPVERPLDDGEEGAAASAEVVKLGERIGELERTRERLSKLYFGQLDENRRHAGKLHDILRVISGINADLDLDTLLDRIATTIQSSLGFRIVLIRVREPGSDRLLAAAFAGLGPQPRATLADSDPTVEQFLSWLRDDFKIGRSYFISHKDAFSGSLPHGYVPDLGRREEWEWHPEDVLLVPLSDAAGELVGYFSVDDPVDRLVPSREAIELLEIFGSHAVVAIENARLYRQLAERTRELEEADQRMKEMGRLKGHFVSAISHELRTPLTAIQTYADTLLATGIENVPIDRLRHFLQVIDDEGRRLGRLIESVLDLNRLDSGRTHPQRAAMDLGEVLEESLWLLRRMGEARQVDLKVERGIADTHVDADRDQMRQLILHLGSNAIKFTPAGGRVVLRLLGDERQVVLQVEDTGIGIAEGELEKIFDRFYQVDSSLARRHGGTGLGLSICKSIVEWHGGDIRALSTPGRGACFTVTLPRRTVLRVVMRPGSDLSATTRDVLRLAVEVVSEVMNAGVVSLMSREPGGGLAIEAALGLEEAVVREARVRPGVGVSGWVAENRRPVCVARPGSTEVNGSGRAEYNTGTFLSVPLESGDGLLGVLNVTDPVSRLPFQAEDCHLLLGLAESVSHAWADTLRAEAGQAQVAETTEALRLVLEHVKLGRRNAPDRVRFAQAIAREMALPMADVTMVGFAAAIHDVGMTLVGREIVQQDRMLTEDERARMRRHVELGAALLDRIETMDAVRDIVMSHHEWWDGTGYPRGLGGADIPAGARVLAVVDAFESMTLGRAHRAPMSQPEALDEIRRLRGRQFEPDVVDAFERILPALTVADDSKQIHAAP